MDNEVAQKQEQKKDKSLNELLTSSLVDIYVGPESTHWTLHERLLCHYSPFFTSIFYADDKKEEKKSRGHKSYGLPDEDDYPFELLVGWLYAKTIRAPKTEKDIGPLLGLYLLAEKFEMEQLGLDVVELVRQFYHETSTYPGLRRVQYIYAETDEDNEMREMMVSAIARQLTTSDKIPEHWAKALQRNGQLAVDIIRSIQQWHIEERSIPDVREGSQSRGRNVNGFSAIEREGDSAGTDDTNMGVQSLDSGASDAPNVKSDAEETGSGLKLSETSPTSRNLSHKSTPRPPAPRIEPPDKIGHADEDQASLQEMEGNGELDTEETQAASSKSDSRIKAFIEGIRLSSANRAESLFLLSAWMVYFIYNVSAFGKGATWS